MSESDGLIPSETNQQSCVKCQNCLCSQSKASILIILWTVFIGAAYTLLCIGFTRIVQKSQIAGRTLDSVVTYPVSIFYSILAIVAMLYPLIGFMADFHASFSNHPFLVDINHCMCETPVV